MLFSRTIKNNKLISLLLLFSNLSLLCTQINFIQCQQQVGVVITNTNEALLIDPTQQTIPTGNNYPYYMQSPFTTTTTTNGNSDDLLIDPIANLVSQEQQQQINNHRSQWQNPETGGNLVASRQVSATPAPAKKRPTGRRLAGVSSTANNEQMSSDDIQQSVNTNATTPPFQSSGCLYEKNYFLKLDECLARKPFSVIGLPAYKNEDLLIKTGLYDKHGCVFILNNGLFKNFHLTKYAIDSDTECLDNTKVGLSMSFQNVSLAYLWTLRCLNQADQLLDDSTLNGKTIIDDEVITSSSSKNDPSTQNINVEKNKNESGGICVGSSQNFGFTSLQLTGIEAQIEVSSDIYKNWRVTNITVAMTNPSTSSSSGSSSGARALAMAAAAGGTGNSINNNYGDDDYNTNSVPVVLGTNIKEFLFESLDGDELNWRYLHLFQNWSRNKIHKNFLEQYRRFLWHSIQRCLTESSEKLPVKLIDLFAPQRFT